MKKSKALNYIAHCGDVVSIYPAKTGSMVVINAEIRRLRGHVRTAFTEIAFNTDILESEIHLGYNTSLIFSGINFEESERPQITAVKFHPYMSAELGREMDS